MCSSVRQYAFLSHIFFARVAYAAQPKTKGKRDLSFSLVLTHIRNKSHHKIFFDESDKPDRKSLRQVTHGVIKKKKKELILRMIELRCKNKPYVYV
jgi:hypothetical protein